MTRWITSAKWHGRSKNAKSDNPKVAISQRSCRYCCLNGSGAPTPTNVGDDSATLTIESPTVAQSGSSVSVSISIVADAPAQSDAATLVVTSIPITPPSNPPAAGPPGLSSEVILQAPPNVTSAQNFSATLSEVPQGLVAVCFVMNDPALDLFNLGAESDVTDSLNDSFQLITSQPQSVLYPPPNSATEQGCFLADTMGGSDVTITFDTQGLVDPANVIAVALLYQGLHTFDSSLNYSIAPVSTGPCYTNSQITYSESPEWVIAIANASHGAVVRAVVGALCLMGVFSVLTSGNFLSIKGDFADLQKRSMVSFSSSLPSRRPRRRVSFRSRSTSLLAARVPASISPDSASVAGSRNAVCSFSSVSLAKSI